MERRLVSALRRTVRLACASAALLVAVTTLTLEPHSADAVPGDVRATPASARAARVGLLASAQLLPVADLSVVVSEPTLLTPIAGLLGSAQFTVTVANAAGSDTVDPFTLSVRAPTGTALITPSRPDAPSSTAGPPNASTALWWAVTASASSSTSTYR